MKRYMLFAGRMYYPLGGGDDFVASFDSIDEAKAHFASERTAEGISAWERPEWAHIFDTEPGVVLLSTWILSYGPDAPWEPWTAKHAHT